jgi:hypothetical protein
MRIARGCGRDLDYGMAELDTKGNKCLLLLPHYEYLDHWIQPGVLQKCIDAMEDYCVCISVRFNLDKLKVKLKRMAKKEKWISQLSNSTRCQLKSSVSRGKAVALDEKYARQVNSSEIAHQRKALISNH